MKIWEFLDNLYRFGLEFFRRYYGPYRAIVISNQDPLRQGRIQVKCPRARLSEDNGVWVYPMMHGAGANKGMFWPPDVGDAVWIFFDNGDPTLPLGYIGGWYGGVGQTELPKDLEPGENNIPHKRGFVTPGGSKIIFDDTSNEETITIQHPDGKQILITGSKVRIGDKNGKFEKMFRAETVLKWLLNHKHSHSFGPTGMPIDPFPSDGLSDDAENS